LSWVLFDLHDGRHKAGRAANEFAASSRTRRQMASIGVGGCFAPPFLLPANGFRNRSPGVQSSSERGDRERWWEQSQLPATGSHLLLPSLMNSPGGGVVSRARCLLCCNDEVGHAGSWVCEAYRLVALPLCDVKIVQTGVCAATGDALRGGQWWGGRTVLSHQVSSCGGHS
jgi:hypothetical protein